MKKVYFKTFGCRTNQFDTQVMIHNLKNYAVTDNEEEADIVVVNSCTVTNGADSGVRNYLNKLSREGKEVHLTGCGALTQGESLFHKGALKTVFGHSEKKNIETFLRAEKPRFELGDLTHIDETIVPEFVGKSRAFIKIQEGCNFACSYCIIPSVRGEARSLSEQTILEQIERLASNGFGEFILTGTNVGSYGRERGENLARLLKKMSLLRGVRRIRIGSLEPGQIDEELKELVNEPWMARHLHIALQHSHNTMLKKMNRRNCVESDLALFEELASYGYALGTDYIVGFPGESEQIWQEALTNLTYFPLTHIHPFIFSPRSDTPAALLKADVRGDVAKERLVSLNTLVKKNNYNFRKNYHGPVEILVESNPKEGVYSGYDQFYNKMQIYSSCDISGLWISVSDYTVKEECNETYQ